MFYIQGKMHEEFSMMRCKMHKAEAIFLIPDKNAKNQSDQDTQTVLSLFSIKRFLASKLWFIMLFIIFKWKYDS